MRLQILGLAALAGIGLACTTSDNDNPFAGTAGRIGGGGAGTTGGAGTGSAGTNATAGTTGSAGTNGVAGTTGSAGTNATAGSNGAAGAGTAGATGTAGTGSVVVGGDITKVLPTAGCGMAPGATVGGQTRGTIMTMGTKAADCTAHLKNGTKKCGPWSIEREYFINLPTGYMNTKAYPIVFQGPGCGGGGKNVYDLNGNVNNSVIRIGLTPADRSIGHGTNPEEGCFDDKEADDSVDWVFYENLWDKLATTLCFDKNRVFASGDSSGAWFSNEVGCKYAGDGTHPIRGIMPNTGGLPEDPRWVPTCTNKPMAGMWIHETDDGVNPFTGNKIAIARAMKVNACTIGTNYDNSMYDDFPIGGGKPANTCKKMRGCPELYPLVICELPGREHGSHPDTANPGFSTFMTMFTKAPFLTQ